jgi:hypothetical protein
MTPCGLAHRNYLATVATHVKGPRSRWPAQQEDLASPARVPSLARSVQRRHVALPALAEHFDPASPLDPHEVEAHAALVADLIVAALRLDKPSPRNA